MEKLSKEEQGIWWSRQIKEGKKSKEDMKSWLDGESGSWSLGDRAVFKAGYVGTNRPWKEWYA